MKTLFLTKMGKCCSCFNKNTDEKSNLEINTIEKLDKLSTGPQ
jgi:hypothetical protein